MKKIVFLGGLPRSGSTLLCSLLDQHPEIKSGGTSGLSFLVENVRSNFTQSDIFKASKDKDLDSRFKNSLRGLIQGWSHFPNNTYIDKSRGWVSLWGLLNILYDKPILIVPIRDLRSVFCSMEKLYRQNLYRDPVENIDSRNALTVEGRYSNWASNVPVGVAIGSLKSLIDTKQTKGVIFVKYEELCRQPQTTLSKIYNKINLQHNDINYPITNVGLENDRVHGILNLHEIGEFSIDCNTPESNNILGTDICNQITRDYDWFYNYFNY